MAKAYKHGKKAAGRFVQLPEWLQASVAWGYPAPWPKGALHRAEAPLQRLEQRSHHLESQRRGESVERTPQHGRAVVPRIAGTRLHPHDASAASGTFWYWESVCLGIGRRTDGRHEARSQGFHTMVRKTKPPHKNCATPAQKTGHSSPQTAPNRCSRHK